MEALIVLSPETTGAYLRIRPHLYSLKCGWLARVPKLHICLWEFFRVVEVVVFLKMMAITRNRKYSIPGINNRVDRAATQQSLERIGRKCAAYSVQVIEDKLDQEGGGVKGEVESHIILYGSLGEESFCQIHFFQQNEELFRNSLACQQWKMFGPRAA